MYTKSIENCYLVISHILAEFRPDTEGDIHNFA